MSEHTPGPCEWNGTEIVRVGEPAKGVAGLAPDAPEEWGPLFAAAPELLEALEDLVSGSVLDSPVHAFARATIAQAKGEVLMTPQDKVFTAAAAEGYAWLRSGHEDIHEALPHLPTSEMADAWLIGAWYGYWIGHAPGRVHKSRGHSWHVGARQVPNVVRVIDPYDHRHGIKTAGEIT